MQIKYTDDNTLAHSYYIGPGPGNRWRSSTGNKGQFGTAPKEYGRGDFEINPRNKYAADITYKKRYDDVTGEKLPPRDDGDYETYGHGTYYSPAGLKRLAYEESANNARSKKNRLDEDAVKDTDRWVRDDYKNFADTAKNISEASKGTSQMIDLFNVPKKNGRIDLSAMTDAELNNILNRERMERQYNDYFNAPQKNKGADYAKKFFDVLAWGGQQAMTAAQIVSIVRSFR